MTNTTEKTVRVTSYKYANVDKLIATIEKDGNSLKTKIHSVAICLLSHWANNPEAGPEVSEKMTDLQNASPYHSKSFADWVAVCCNMQWADDTKRWYVQKDQKFKKDALDNAKNNPFWEVSPPPAPKPFTDEMVVAMLENILKKKERHTDKPVEGDAFTNKGNEQIRAAINSIKGS